MNQFNQSGQIIQQNIPLNNQINPNNIISPYRQMIETQGINGGRIEQTVYIQRPDSLKNLSSNNQWLALNSNIDIITVSGYAIYHLSTQMSWVSNFAF